MGCILCLVGCETVSTKMMSFVGSNEDWLGTFSVTEVEGESYSTLTIQPLAEIDETQLISYELLAGLVEVQTSVHDDQVGVVTLNDLKSTEELSLTINYGGQDETLVLKSTPQKPERFRWSLIR